MSTAAAYSGTPPSRPADEWTVADLDALPDDGIRREIIDGVLHVTPSPTFRHQSIAAGLWMNVNASCPAEYAVTQAVEVRINDRRSFTPDVQVVTAEAARANPHIFRPHEVVLVVEIVSPSSQAMDRVLKPALYAEAGIPWYWRIETEPGVVAHTYQLDLSAGVYAPTGSFAKDLIADEPWHIELALDTLLPRVAR